MDEQLYSIDNIFLVRATTFTKDGVKTWEISAFESEVDAEKNAEEARRLFESQDKVAICEIIPIGLVKSVK